MSTHQRLNAAEKDLEKFIKFLALKSTQIVVQSRLGEQIQTQCNPFATGNDWFNIVIQDHPDVYAETKRALSLEPGESILKRLPLCVEISLKTAEGDQMVLEVWSLELQQSSVDSQQKEEKSDLITVKVDNIKGTTSNGSTLSNSIASEQQTLKAAHAIYNRMGILLKSLISLTRATPAYKLSRRQCPDSYGIYYRIYVDKPQVHKLGDGHKQVRIGQLNTIVGTLSMSVGYRTKMTITPTSVQVQVAAAVTDDNIIMLKSDHFRPADITPVQHPVATIVKKASSSVAGTAINESKVIDIDKPLRPGAFTDMGKLRQYTEEDFLLPETPPFDWLLRRTRNESCGSVGSTESLNRKCDSPQLTPLSNQDNIKHNNNKINVTNNNSNSKHDMTVKIDFENEKNSLISAHSLSHSSVNSLLIPSLSANSTHLKSGKTHAPDDDNLLKELNFPFASPNSHVNDLAKFYRDCYHAPPLRGINEIQVESGNSCGTLAVIAADNICTSVDDLSRQLEQFETSLEDYDKLVSQLGLTASSSTGSRSSGGLQMSN